MFPFKLKSINGDNMEKDIIIILKKALHKNATNF